MQPNFEGNHESQLYSANLAIVGCAAVRRLSRTTPENIKRLVGLGLEIWTAEEMSERIAEAVRTLNLPHLQQYTESQTIIRVRLNEWNEGK